jgi:PIN domain nuclease of toxin-antitoxin system
MAGYLLDTNVFLRTKGAPEALRQEALAAIRDPRNRLFVSLAGLWELAIKAAKGKLPLYRSLIAGGTEGLERLLRESNFELLRLELDHALTSAALPQHHRDPFDRIMIAQALLEDLTVITTDDVFMRYERLRVMRA